MNGNQQDGQFCSLDLYERWPDSALEVRRDSHPDPVQRLLASQAWAQRMVERAFCMLEMQGAPDAVIQALHDHPNPYVQAWAMEERSRRVAQRYRDIGQNARNAEEAAALHQADTQAALDEAEAKALAEFGPELDRAIKSRRSRDLVAAFKRKTAQLLAKGFCQRAALGLPSYRVACESLKFYIRQEITASELAVMINVHLQIAPVVWQVTVTSVHGQENWTIDDGGAINGWRELALLMQAHMSLSRFRICPGCDDLFYDASPGWNKKSCGKPECKRLRKRVTKQQERAKKRRAPAD